MFKKFISILLIFSVNTLILTHAVLPHHHHNGIPHFSLSLNGSHSHNGKTDSCCCNKESQNNKDCCSIDQDINVICETENDCFCGLHPAMHDHSDILFQAVLLSFNYNLEFPEKLPLEKPLFYINYYFDPAVRSFGLRAPPFFS